MDANTIEILKECNKGCKMAVQSMVQLLEKIRNTDFCRLVKNSLEKHKEFLLETKELLDQYNEPESSPGRMATAFSWMSTEMKTTMNNEDGEIAKILMDGCNMGIKSVSEYVNKYKDASKESINLAKQLINEEEKLMKELKGYL